MTIFYFYCFFILRRLGKNICSRGAKRPTLRPRICHPDAPVVETLNLTTSLQSQYHLPRSPGRSDEGWRRELPGRRCGSSVVWLFEGVSLSSFFSFRDMKTCAEYVSSLSGCVVYATRRGTRLVSCMTSLELKLRGGPMRCCRGYDAIGWGVDSVRAIYVGADVASRQYPGICLVINLFRRLISSPPPYSTKRCYHGIFSDSNRFRRGFSYV